MQQIEKYVWEQFTGQIVLHEALQIAFARNMKVAFISSQEIEKNPYVDIFNLCKCGNYGRLYKECNCSSRIINTHHNLIAREISKYDMVVEEETLIRGDKVYIDKFENVWDAIQQRKKVDVRFHSEDFKDIFDFLKREKMTDENIQTASNIAYCMTQLHGNKEVSIVEMMSAIQLFNWSFRQRYSKGN